MSDLEEYVKKSVEKIQRLNKSIDYRRIQEVAKIADNNHYSFDDGKVQIGLIGRSPTSELWFAELEPNSEVPVHRHEKQIEDLRVISGSIDIYLGEPNIHQKKIHVKQFDNYTIDKNIAHHIVAGSVGAKVKMYKCPPTVFYSED